LEQNGSTNPLTTFLSILVIGDDPPSILLGELLALEHSVKVKICYNEQEALRWINDGPVNIIFIDPIRQEKQGIDFILQIRKEYSKIVFVLYSYYKDLENTAHDLYRDEGKRFINYYRLDKNLTKPMMLKPLKDVLNNCRRFIGLQYHQDFDYDVALSYAREDREYVDKLANCLKEKNIRVFYDLFEQANLLGKDLAIYLYEVYMNKSRYFIPFISKAYRDKKYPIHEMKAALERALNEKGGEYIIPIRIDDTLIPGLSNTIGHISIEEGISNICSLIATKLKITG
jgi:response regulator RpfG family c-di-GMP phosphodiesterase